MAKKPATSLPTTSELDPEDLFLVVRPGEPVGEKNRSITKTDVQAIFQGGGYYLHEQNSPSSLWTIAHNLGRRPSIQIVDLDGKVVGGAVEHVSINTATFTINAALAGKAICTI